ncbi:hypothetical protein OIDMADRAFT_36534 [Oidiodendron maius Zn]|uniref:SnoaL-like domain-containing protein n=1 Tax=Oidiodendron maius (strain Zn) TaxID=913774 RepID=A0A0C3CS64_OIDMZ|nr:hypothetical protein OIDMADRAFT_36534 [Oidiodendron maius Zn]
MYFNMPTIATFLGLLSCIVYTASPSGASNAASGTSSIASATSVACPPCSATEKEQRQNFDTFVQEFYLDGLVAEPFDKYIWADYIQHNPLIPQGRDAAISFLEPFARNKATSLTKSVDIYRFDGACIVEYWDIIANLTTSEINPTPLSTPTPVTVIRIAGI